MKKTYQSHVKRQSVRNPCLLNLDGFLSNPCPRPIACRMVSLDFFADTVKPKYRRIESVDHLYKELLYGYTAGCKDEDGFNAKNNPQDIPNKRNHLLGQILLIEDLNKEAIEITGSCLNIDPLFFASHIHTPWRDLEAQAPDLATLPSRLKPGTYMNIYYHRTVVFKKFLPPGMKLMRYANVDRKVAVLPLTNGRQIGLAQHCASVLRANRNGRWICLVLVDPPIVTRHLFDARDGKGLVEVNLPSDFFLGGYEDFMDSHPPDTDHDDEPANEFESFRHGLMEDLTYYWSTKLPECFDSKQPSLMSVSYYPLKIIAAEWVKYLALMHRSIKQYEYSNRKDAQNFLGDLEKLNSDMRALQIWRRRSMSSQQKLQAVNRLLRYNATSCSHSEEYRLLVEDYDYLSLNMDEFGRRLERMLPVVTSLVQIVDSRRSFAETANISRLTILALVFVPLTFVASLFSMSPDKGPGGHYFWVYFVVALPVTLVVYLIARPPMKILSLTNWSRRRRKPSSPIETVDPFIVQSEKPEV